MLGVTQLKIQTKVKKAGQGGKAKGGTAADLVKYLKDAAARQYYAGGEAQSTSLGGGWADLNIDQATDEQLLNVLNGYGPDGIELANRVANSKGEVRIGYDLTFSPPKEFSLVAEFGDEDWKEKMRAIERRAVAETVSYIEEMGFVETRSGKGGKDREPAQNLLFQANYHNTSRSHDPARHTHLVMMNLAKNSEGKWRRIEAKALFVCKKEIGAIYRSEIAKGLVEAGFAVERDKESFKIVGIDRAIRDQFSKGAAKIKELLGEGQHSSKAKDAAALKVRGEKELKSREDLEKSWDEQLEQFSTTREYLLDSVASIGRNSEEKFSAYSEKEVISALGRKATFTDLDLRREVSQAMAAGAGGVEEIKAAIAAMRSSQELVKLKSADGKELYTTKQNRQNEIESLKILASRQGHGKPLSEESFRIGLEKAEQIKGFKYTAEQRAAVRMLTTSRKAMDVYLQGVAGAGKSTLALVVRLAYEAENRKVYGAALAGKAASGLSDGTGIETSTIDSLLLKDNQNPLEDGSIILVDESSMVDTSKFRQLVELADRRNLELSFIGDTKQLQAIGAGSIFAHLFERAKPEDRFEIVDATRQKGEHAKDWKVALKEMRDGNSRPAFEAIEKFNNLKISEDGEEIKEAITIWQKNRKNGIEDKDNILVTNTNAMKKCLNEAARLINGQAQRKDNITVKTTNRDGESTGTRQFAPGDRIMTLRNAKLGGVNLKSVDNDVRKRADKTQNGAVWTINGIKSSRISGGKIIKMTNDAGQSIKFNTLEYNNLDHAYAFTVHQSQGISSKAVTNLASSAAMTDRHSAYVMLSRSELAERTAFVVPNSMVEEREILEGVEESSEQSIADRMQSFISTTQRERIDNLSIMMVAESYDLQEREAEDMAIINAAFPEQENRQTESTHVQMNQSRNDLYYYEHLVAQQRQYGDSQADHRKTLEEFEQQTAEAEQAAWEEYERMQAQQQYQGRRRSR